MRELMLEQEGNISPGDLEMIMIYDTSEEVIEHFREFYTHNKLGPNF
jgi:hypothetical protein